MKRGFLFTTDALLGMLLLVGGLILLASITDHSRSTEEISSVSTDVLRDLRSTRIYEVNDPWVQALVANGTIEDSGASVLEQIGTFWAIGMDSEASQLASIWLDSIQPELGLTLRINGTSVYGRNSSKGDLDTTVASQMVTGIAQGEAITGNSASAYLRRIKDKRTLSFSVFGGFVGQGNISLRFETLPPDANVTDIALELASGAPFTVAFNSNPCLGTFTPVDTNGTPTSWNLTACNASLVPGAMNILSINFTAPLNSSYVAGGFLTVKYKSGALNENFTNDFLQYRFPGVDGIANLYDAFYVPGTLRNMSIYLHYWAPNVSYLQIGDKRVWEEAANGSERKITLSDAYLRDPLGGKLDYDFLSNKTVPLRYAGYRPEMINTTTGNADIVIITDFSGSMKKAVADYSEGNLGYNCESASIWSASNVRRTLLAKCVDGIFVDNIMNYTGNRIWPVNIFNDAVKYYNNPTDGDAIASWIDNENQNGKGKTCYACALNLAYDILKDQSGPNRSRFVVFMTDGTPTHCADGSCTSNSTIYGALQCGGLCDVPGQNCGDLVASCNECIANPGGQTNAYSSAQRLFSDLNATIYAVGFGPVDDCSFADATLQQIALLGNGTYQHSENSSELKLIYENISQEIILATKQTSQTVVVQGNVSASRLYDDSHINITYDLASQYLPKQNTLAVTLQADRACNPIVPLYAGQQLIESQAVSYSGIHWTDVVRVGGSVVYNLSEFLKPYIDLGDPTLVNTPVSNYSFGNNVVTIETGDSSVNRTGCSMNNTAFYTVLVNLSTERSRVVPGAEGCVWTVQFEDGTYDTITIPASYSGSNACSYNESAISYDSEDAYQLGAYEIFRKLDFKKDGKLYVDLNDEDLEIIVTTISSIPYLWGPTLATVEVTR